MLVADELSRNPVARNVTGSEASTTGIRHKWLQGFTLNANIFGDQP